MVKDYSQMTDAELDAELAKTQKTAPVDYSKMSDAEIDAAHAKLMNGQPGVASIGTTDGNPTPAADESLTSKLMRYGGNTLGAIGKGFDALGGGDVVRPALASLAEGATGKNLYSSDELLNSINPTNLKTFPSSSELMKRAGVPEGAKLSDYVGGYGQPGQSPWYQPEKGGLLDPTLRGTGGFGMDVATDPLTYLTLGLGPIGKKALAEGATRMATEEAARANAGPIGRVLQKAGDIGSNAIDKVTSPLQALAQKLGQSKVGQGLNSALQLPSEAVGSLGEKLYNAPVLAAEHEGQKFGKQGVAQTMYDSGIANPLNLAQKTQDVTNTLMNKSNGILRKAGDAGAALDMKAAMNPAREQAAKIRAEGRPNQQWVADALEKAVDEHEAMGGAKEAIPPSQTQVPTGLLDESGQPILKTLENPGTPAIQGKPVTPLTGGNLVSDQYKATPNAAFNELLRTPEGAQVTKPLSQGIRKATMDSVASALGPEAADTASTLRSDAGKLLSTQKASQRISNLADRLAHSSVAPSGITKLVLLAGGPGAAAADMGLNAARLTTMPAGYGLRKLSEGQLTAPLINNYFRRKLTPNQGGQ